MELALAEQLAQAPVFVRKFDGEILYWTTGAQELYGYEFKAAVGRISHELFKTVFPEPLAEINRTLLQTGVWQGVLSHTKADGTPIWVGSRWRLKETADVEGPIVVETNADVTQRETSPGNFTTGSRTRWRWFKASRA